MKALGEMTGKEIGESLLAIERIISLFELRRAMALAERTEDWMPREERGTALNGLEHLRVVVQEASVPSDEKHQATEKISTYIVGVYDMPKERKAQCSPDPQGGIYMHLRPRKLAMGVQG